MTLIHIVLFKFRQEISSAHKARFVQELKTLKNLACVKDHRLLGFHFALLSYHHDRKGLEEYQSSEEHHRITSELLWPYKEDVIRFDFDVDPEDEYICEFVAKSAMSAETFASSNIEERT